MCLSAIIWSNIKTVYYASTIKEVGKIGFRDDMIYEFLKSDKNKEKVLRINRIESKEADALFEDFKNNKDKIIY